MEKGTTSYSFILQTTLWKRSHDAWRLRFATHDFCSFQASTHMGSTVQVGNSDHCSDGSTGRRSSARIHEEGAPFSHTYSHVFNKLFEGPVSDNGGLKLHTPPAKEIQLPAINPRSVSPSPYVVHKQEEVDRRWSSARWPWPLDGNPRLRQAHVRSQLARTLDRPVHVATYRPAAVALVQRHHCPWIEAAT